VSRRHEVGHGPASWSLPDMTLTTAIYLYNTHTLGLCGLADWTFLWEVIRNNDKL